MSASEEESSMTTLRWSNKVKRRTRISRSNMTLINRVKYVQTMDKPRRVITSKVTQMLSLLTIIISLQQVFAFAPTANKPCEFSNNNNNNNILGFVPPPSASSSSLLVCPGSNQHNNMPQFPPKYINPNVERQQREILKHLNTSFTNYLQLNGPAISSQTSSLSRDGQSSLELVNTDPMPTTLSPSTSLANELIDDQLLNEIISPLVVDAAYQRAKELIVKRRKLENELVRHGFITDMSKPTAVARHQRVTTTTTRGNELEKAQEVFEEMSKILAKK